MDNFDSLLQSILLLSAKDAYRTSPGHDPFVFECKFTNTYMIIHVQGRHEISDKLEFGHNRITKWLPVLNHSYNLKF